MLTIDLFQAELILLNDLPQPGIRNTRDESGINLKKDCYFYQPHVDDTASFNYEFKMEFGNCLFTLNGFA